MKLNPHLPEIIEELRDERYRPHPRDIRTAVDELESMARRIDALEELTERLTAERDEARRRLCIWAQDDSHGDGREYAKEQGWDCYEEDGK
jgi:hypothetical protein